jgi:3-oxoacyl-[acyl-carrier-protein] synthase II
MGSEARRVVITGLGPVSCLGVGKDASWAAVSAGRSGIRKVEVPDRMAGVELPVTIGGRVWDFDPAQFMNPKQVRRTDRCVHYAVAASKLAWEDAGTPEVDPSRTGVVMATGIGGLEFFVNVLRKYLGGEPWPNPDRVSPFTVPALMPNAAAGHIAMEFGFTGPNLCVATACSAGGHALIDAYMWIKHGFADTVVAGGTEAQLIEVTINGMAQAGAVSKNRDPERASRPFDRDRDGFVLSEGAAALVLEDAERAAARGAHVYAELAGVGMSGDAYHITAPHPEGLGAIAAMEMALQEAGEAPESIDYINAHGTSTQLNDAAETRAVKKLFGDHAYNVAISSTKSMHGHLIGAAGALEAVITSLAMEHRLAPPTINYENPDEECDLDYVPNEARPLDIRVAMSNSFAFGGQNASLVFRRFEP